MQSPSCPVSVVLKETAVSLQTETQAARNVKVCAHPMFFFFILDRIEKG